MWKAKYAKCLHNHNIIGTVNCTLGHHPQLGLYFAHDVPQPSVCTTKHWLQTFRLLSNPAICQMSDRTARPADAVVGYKIVDLPQGCSSLRFDIWSSYRIELAYGICRSYQVLWKQVEWFRCWNEWHTATGAACDLSRLWFALCL